MKKEQQISFIFLLTSFLIIIYPILKGGIWIGHDISAHVDRANAINAEIEHFQLVAGFDFFNAGRLGYAWGLFYPPVSALLILVSKVLTLGMAGILTQLKLSFVLIIFISAYTSFLCGKYLFKDISVGIWTSFLYINSVYLLSNIFLRFAFGESVAACFIPLLIVGLIATFRDEKEKLWLPISASLVALSNIPIFLCSVCVAGLMIVILYQNLNYKAICWMLISFCIIIILTFFYFFPLWYEMAHNTIWAKNNMNYDFKNMWNGSAELSTLLTGDETVINHEPVGSFRSIGLFNIILFFVSYVRSDSRMSSALSILGLTSILISTKFFPWYAIPWIFNVMTYIQFPWRFLVYSSLFASLVSAKFITSFKLDYRNTFFFLILSATCLTTVYTLKPTYQQRQHDYHALTSLYNDYLPVDSNKSKILSRKKDILFNDRDGHFDAMVSYRYGYPDFIFDANGERVSLPVLDYKILRIQLNGAEVERSQKEGMIEFKSVKGMNFVSIRPSAYLYVPLILSLFGSVVFFIYCGCLIKRH